MEHPTDTIPTATFLIKGTTSTPLPVAIKITATPAAHAVAVSVAAAVLAEVVAAVSVPMVHALEVASVMVEEDKLID